MILPLKNYTIKLKFVNGNWIGTVKEPYKFYKYMKQKKYEGIINIFTSITFDFRQQEINICNDAGRIK